MRRIIECCLCKRERPHYAKGLCGGCYAKNPKARAYRSNWNKEKWRSDPAFRDKQREYRRTAEYREKHRDARRCRKSGHTPAGLQVLRASQGGRCGICSVLLVKGRGPDAECADHCHTSGVARGLLCSICNRALGYYEVRQHPAGLVIQAYDAYIRKYLHVMD